MKTWPKRSTRSVSGWIARSQLLETAPNSSPTGISQARRMRPTPIQAPAWRTSSESSWGRAARCPRQRRTVRSSWRRVKSRIAAKRKRMELERGLPLEVRDVREDADAGRHEGEPGVLPAEDRPAGDVGQQPGDEDHQQDERQRVRGDAAEDQRVQPVAHARPQLRPARGEAARAKRVGELHGLYDHAHRHGEAERDAGEEERQRPEAHAREQAAGDEAERGGDGQQRHLVDPVGARDREREGELGGAEQREAEPVLPRAEDGRLLGCGLEQLGQAAAAGGVVAAAGEAGVPAGRGHGSAQPAAVTGATARAPRPSPARARRRRR